MKHQRGKVSKPRGLVQRLEQQADKEVKSWSPSQANSDLLFLFSTTYLSTSYIQNYFPFYKHVRRGKRKNSTMKGPRNNMLKQKQKENTNTNTKVKTKRRCNYRILSDYIKHQTSTREEVRKVSESRYPRSADYIYIYIYSLQAKSTYKL